jgi:hypothetical protein
VLQYVRYSPRATVTHPFFAIVTQSFHRFCCMLQWLNHFCCCDLSIFAAVTQSLFRICQSFLRFHHALQWLNHFFLQWPLFLLQWLCHFLDFISHFCYFVSLSWDFVSHFYDFVRHYRDFTQLFLWFTTNCSKGCSILFTTVANQCATWIYQRWQPLVNHCSTRITVAMREAGGLLGIVTGAIGWLVGPWFWVMACGYSRWWIACMCVYI